MSKPPRIDFKDLVVTILTIVTVVSWFVPLLRSGVVGSGQ